MSIGTNLSINNVTKYYKNFKAVDNVSLSIDKGEFLTILGPSGSGKTSILKLIVGFENVNSGEIMLDNKNIEMKKPHERNIGMMFQNYALFPHMTINENIAYPLKLRRESKAEITKKVTEILKLVDLEEVGDRYPKQLSGGQQQRVALARAIVFNPPLLLLDEPLGALDRNLRQKMQLEIKHIQQKVGITTISVTHDQEEALTMSDKICIMNKGKVEQIDTPENIYIKPKNRFVAEFMGEINILEGEILELKRNIALVKIFNKQLIKVEVENSNEFLEKEKILVTLRPENVIMVENKLEYENTVDAVVNETIFIGDSLKIKAVMDNGEEILIKAPSSVKNYLWQGKQITLAWEISKCSLIKN